VKQMKAELKQRYEQVATNMAQQVKLINQQIALQKKQLAELVAAEAAANAAKAEGPDSADGNGENSSNNQTERDEENDASQQLKLKIKALTAQIELSKRRLPMYEQQMERMKARATPSDEQIQQMISYRTRVTGIACCPDGVFVACSATKGYGYEIWLLNTDLAEPKKITEGQRGCCGQFDIQSHKNRVYAAANCRFNVVGFDQDGKEAISFGKRGRNAIDGFGSCCNPMNIRFTPNGDCYTAEASVGAIKRFNHDGEFQGVVAKAELVPGCKHVAIDVTPDGKRVYMLDITRSQIYVFDEVASEETPSTASLDR